MRAAVYPLLALFLATHPAGADDKPPLPARAPAAMTACNLSAVVYDWDFANDPHDFSTADCDQSGMNVWQYGPTSTVPGAPPNVWGTVLNGDYPNDSGEGLVSPGFIVGPATAWVEVHHFFAIEADYDGCNLSVGIWPAGQVVEPFGGYPFDTISASASYYAFCVDGEPGWSGESEGWRIDCFDLSGFMGQFISLEFDFGSDSSVTAPGWYIARVLVGSGPGPEAVCCFPDSFACQVQSELACLEQGGTWHPDWPSCEPSPCPVPTTPILQAGPWLNAEPWHNWISDAEGEVPVSFLVPPHFGPISTVEFGYSTDDGVTWEWYATDGDGSEPRFDTVSPDVLPVGDGWSAVFQPVAPIPQGPVIFRAIAVPVEGEPIEGVTVRQYDPAPPSLAAANIEDWMEVDEDTLGVEIDPNGTTVSRILIFLSQKDDNYVKGVPGITQHMYSETHCAPTATAQCLKYFEAHGDPVVTNGFSDYTLIGALAAYMGTNQFEPGTLLSHWIEGVTEWVRHHGNGYTVRTLTTFDQGGTLTWATRHWQVLRNELERGQDVLVGVFWPNGGGHAMTLDTIVNTPLPNGRILLGFKDPWTAETEYGELDPDTGFIYNLSGAGNGGNGYLGAALIICPAEIEPGSGGPGNPVYNGLPPMEPPYVIPIVMPYPADWFLHVEVINVSGNAHRNTWALRYTPSTYVPEVASAPAVFYLNRCSPSPFRTSTEISFTVAAEARVAVAVYDIAGRKIRTLVDDMVEPGLHALAWDGTDDDGGRVAAGVYFVKMESPTYVSTRKVTVIR